MDLGSVLAKFTAPGPIKTRANLDAALNELLTIIATSRDEIPLLLNVLMNDTQGLLEAVLTSDGQTASTFRNRVARALRKSPATSIPIFGACAERLGTFLISIPPSISLDRSVMRDFNAYATTTTATGLNSTEAEYNVAKTGNLGPTSPTHAESRHARTSSTNRASSTNATSEPNSLFPRGPRASSKPSKLLTTFFENFLATCINPEIEGFAIDTLFKTLTPDHSPVSSGIAPTKAASPIPSVDYAPGVSSSDAGTSAQLHYLSIKQEDIIKYLNHAAKPTSRNWPVVVSQRGIKRLREFVSDQKDVFLRIEKKIKQLCVGFFPPQNQTILFRKNSGIPIYTADLGDGLRLIYHIDFGAPTSATGKESQFIRVFGVFRESEIDVKFWGSVATQLGRRGQEYIERCNDRREIRIRFKGVETTPPKLSTPLDVSQWNKEGADIEVDESHLLELHRVLALEKFVPLSRTFFEAIQKFDEHSFMFAVSSSEYGIITHPSSCLVLGRSGTGKTTCMLFRMAVLEMDSKESHRPTRQMFVTQSRTLASKVQQYWTKLLQAEQGEVVVDPGAKMPGLSLIDIDEDAEDNYGLPSKFSELEDSHFPVFLTYDKLCKLLEADYGLQFNPSASMTAFHAFRRARQQGAIRQPFISFKYFEANIWPRFDEVIKKGLHPILVYSEFMGVIKGSEASRSYPKYCLDRQGYESQSSRTHFGDPTERSRIYTLFEAYLKLRPPASYDVADRVHSLLSAVEERGLLGIPVDYLYVDEAQDHLILDAALLRRVCPNPDGLFFAGDTAQTISVGSTFRFSELKAFLYRLERDEELVKRGSRKPVNPQFFQLSTNYRSHSGIVKSAAYLVRLIISYFGQCIDSLTPEASLVDISAHKPVFFLGRENQSDFLRLFSAQPGGEIKLGAHQVIIVRDEMAAKKLRDVVGSDSVLTIYESKGMEFDDVLLYDFFNDSLATATDWRAILHAEHRGKPFDERRHAILRTELKALYVGLTRARERVWIWDRSEKGTDLKTLLTALNLATVHDISGAVPQFGVSSGSHEWLQRAQQYFSKGLFQGAALSFKRAGMDWWERVAMAYDDRQATMKLPEHDSLLQSSFTRVAREFERLARSPEALDDQITRNRLYVNAGECFAAVSNHDASASAFTHGKRYTEAAYHHRMAGSFEKAVDIIKRHHVDPEIAESITYAAKIAYTKRGDASSLRKAWDLSGSRDDFLKFLEDQGFEEQKITFLESIQEYERVGDIYRAAENYISAVYQFRRAHTTSSQRKAAACLLEGLRANISFSIGYGKRSNQLSQLIELGQVSGLTEDEQNEFDLLCAVSELDLARLKEHGLRCIRSGNTIHALLALDCWASSDVFRDFKSASDVEAAEILTTCLKFSAVVNTLVRTPNILDKSAARDLFCIAKKGLIHSDTVSMKRHSFVYNSLNGAASNRKGAFNQPTPVMQSKKVVEDEIRRGVWNRLNRVINYIDALARESRAYELCIPFVTTGRCLETERELCWRDHPPTAELTVPKFNSRFRLTVLTITLLNQPNYDRWDEHKVGRAVKQRAWLNRLFKLCFPSTNQAGNLSDVVPSLIPEYKEAMKIVNSCLSALFQGLRPGNGPREFLNTIMRTALLASAFDYNSTASYFKHGQWALDTDIAIRHGLIIPATQRPLIGAALPWFIQDIPERTNLGVSFLEAVVGGGVWIDVDVVIAFVEEVCAQLILNQEAHHLDGRRCLTMPRSWIIRAFSRGVSPQANGSIPEHFVSLLGKFIRVLLLREHHKGGCKLQVEGAPLTYIESCTTRYQGLVRLSRCLSLVGHNIPRLRETVLSIFKRMGNACSDIQLYASCLAWNEVVEAMKFTSSSLDELISVHWKKDIIDEYGLKAMFCSDDQTLLQELSLVSTGTTSDSQVTLAQGQPNSPPSALVPVSEMEGQETPEASVDNLPAQSPDDAGFLDKSATTIQAFIRRHQTRHEDSLWTVFMELSNQRIQMTTLEPPSRFLLLCLRGPLPHVVEFLEKFKDTVQSEVNVIGKLAVKKDENQKALSPKLVELRRIRNEVKKLIKELRPPSDFYFGGKSNSPASVFDIVEKVKAAHGLVQRFRPFMEIPEDLDYELGVEPLLSDRVPWAQVGVASGASGVAASF